MAFLRTDTVGVFNCGVTSALELLCYPSLRDAPAQKVLEKVGRHDVLLGYYTKICSKSLAS